MTAREVERRYALEVYPMRDITVVRGAGAEVWDDQGRRYLDCVAGIGVASVGHANPAVAEAVARQARTLITCPGIFYNDQRAALMEKLVALAPEGLERVFLCNSGTEAVEASFKLARLATGRTKIVSTVRGFHGRTLGALSATFKKSYREPFKPLVPGFSFVPFNNAAKMRAAVDGETAAVVLEPVQGEGGIRPADAEYLAALRKICDTTGALLIADEAQTGFCRTGRMFACDRYGLRPDLMCVAKAVAGGVPMGAVLAGGRVPSALGRHGTTFGGNPLACAAALAAISYMEEHRLAERAEVLGRRFCERLFGSGLGLGQEPKVRAVRQVGLMIGVELRERCQPYLAALMKRGVLALPAGATVIRLLPPLVITGAQVDEAADAVAEVLA